MDSNVSVTKSNALIEAGYRLSLTEMQIILYGISLVNPLAEDFPLQYRIDIKSFAGMFNRDYGSVYTEVKEAVISKFWERDFSYRDEKGNIVTNRWLTQIKRQDKTGYIEIKFSDELRPYLHQLKKHFTTYYIDQISSFKSIYAVRFYEMSVMHLRKGEYSKRSFRLKVSEIRDRLELHDKYKRFYDLKNRVLESAKRDINKHSDIRFDYSMIKIGREVDEIEFTVYKKARAKSELKAESKGTVTTMKPHNLTPAIFEKAKKIIAEAGDKWDLYAIEQQFYEYMKKKGQPESLGGAFLGFVKKKVQSSP